MTATPTLRDHATMPIPLFLLWILFVNSAAADTTQLPSPSQATGSEIQVAAQRIENAIVADPLPSPGRVVVVYFTPKNVAPAANHTERIRRITEEAAGFYQRELNRHGWKNREMNVLRNEAGEVDVIDVVGAGQGGDYGKPDGGKIRAEVVPVLRQRSIDPDASVILLFCNLMDYDPVHSTISHHSPYYGGGSHLAGTAWQCDSEILDPLRFRDTTPIRDGEYGNITIGKHNSIFIGGVIHELGHALSLPHCRQRTDEEVRGTALMGSGNRTYAQELRGEGRGCFLTQAHALRLAAHPVFNTQVTQQIRQRPEVNWKELRIDVADNHAIRIQGHVNGSVPVHGVVAYFDPAGRGDYDATTASAVPDDEGRFVLQSEPLRPGSDGEIRLLTCHVNATTSTRVFPYRIDKNGTPDLSSIRLELELGKMIESLRDSKLLAAEKTLQEIAGDDPELLEIGNRILTRFHHQADAEAINLDQLDVNVSSVALSQVKPESASVGWLRPTYNAIPAPAKILSIGGEYFASGIYAHAPAKHVYQLDKKWNRLTGRCGIQAGHRGSVDFEILGDGRLLWNARNIGPGQGGRYDIDITGVQTLSLLVGDAGNNAGDWGVWIEPTLSRTN